MWSLAANAAGRGFRLLKGWPGRAQRCEAVIEQLEHADIRRGQLHRLDVDDEMATALPERVDALRSLCGRPAQPHAGRPRLEALPQRLHQDQFAGFARRRREVAFFEGRIERFVGAEQTFHAGEDDVDRGRKLERLGRWHEPLPGAHE